MQPAIPRPGVPPSLSRAFPLRARAGVLPEACRRGACLGLALALVLGLPAPRVAAEDPAPFAARTHAIRGQVHQVWSLRIADCATPATDLLVLVTRGRPPRAEKRVLWMPCGSALTPDAPRIVSRRLPDDTALVDVARVPGRAGAQLVLASQDL